MLNLIEAHKIHSDDYSFLDSTIDLLWHTKLIVDFSKDRRPLLSVTDKQLFELECVRQWFLIWEQAVAMESPRPVQGRCKQANDKRNRRKCSVHDFGDTIFSPVHPRKGRGN